MLTRIQVLNLLEQEREYILSQTQLPTSDPPKGGRAKGFAAGMGLPPGDYYFYSTVGYDADFPSRLRRLSMATKFWMHPLLCRIRLLGGGGMFVAAERPL
jgi:hypothetical protein